MQKKKQRLKPARQKKGEEEDDWKACSPSLYYALNALYGWTGTQKIKGGWVVDSIDVDGIFHQGLVQMMEKRGLVGSHKLFVALNENKKPSAYGEGIGAYNVAKGFDSSPGDWLYETTGDGGLSFYMVSLMGGYHSIMMGVDRRDQQEKYYFWDQHGNKSTGSELEFDRLIPHNKKEIEDYFLKMINKWGHKNGNLDIFELKAKV